MRRFASLAPDPVIDMRLFLVLAGFFAWVGGCRGRSNDNPLPVAATTVSAADEPARASLLFGGDKREESSADPIPVLPSYRKHAGVEQPRSQQVACGERGFVRLLPSGFEGYTYSDLALTFRSDKRKFTHVVAQAGHSYLMVGAIESLVYYQPHTHLLPLTRLPALGPFQLWADVRRRDWVWVHYLRDDAVHLFELPALARVAASNSMSEHPSPARAALRQSVVLSDFDGKSVERTYSGGFVHTRYDGNQSPGADTAVLLLSNFGRAGVAHARASTVTLHPPKGGADSGVEVKLQGHPFSMVEAEGRVALITHRSSDSKRDWQLEVVLVPRVVRRVPLPSHTTEPAPDNDPFTAEVANRSLCLVPGKPWVVVGGKTAVSVIDYDTGNTLLRR